MSCFYGGLDYVYRPRIQRFINDFHHKKKIRKNKKIYNLRFKDFLELRTLPFLVDIYYCFSYRINKEMSKRYLRTVIFHSSRSIH